MVKNLLIPYIFYTNISFLAWSKSPRSLPIGHVRVYQSVRNGEATQVLCGEPKVSKVVTEAMQGWDLQPLIMGHLYPPVI